MTVSKTMKANNTLELFGSATLAALVIHASVTHVAAGVAASIGQNFTGYTGSLAWNQDASGAVSEDYFAEFNIDNFSVYNKADGSLVETLWWQDFWSQAGVRVTFPSTDRACPRIVYDPAVQRWFAAEPVGDPSAPAQLLLAVSASADPTGAWNGMVLASGLGTNNVAKFVSLGLDADGVYVSGIFAALGSSNPIFQPTGSTLLSLPKADLLLNPPITTNQTLLGPLSLASYGYFLQPVICFDGSAGGNVLATAGQGDPGENNTNLFAFAVQNATGPGPATLSSPRVLRVPAYIDPANALQPDGSDNLTDWVPSFTSPVQRVGGALFGAVVTQVGNRVGVNWYRVDANNSTLLESGTISNPTLDLYYPSIAANKNGTVVLAFNGSGSNTFVSCYAVVGQTVNGVTTFGSLLLLKAGIASSGLWQKSVSVVEEQILPLSAWADSFD